MDVVQVVADAGALVGVGEDPTLSSAIESARGGSNVLKPSL